MNKIVLVVMLLGGVFFGCTKAIKEDPLPFAPVEVQELTESEIKNRVQLICDKTCTKEESLQSVIIADKVTEVIFGKCFEDYFKAKSTFYFSKDTGAQVVAKLKSTKLDLGLTYFVKKRNPFTGNIVVGFENGDGKIHANRVAWSGMSFKDKVSNVAHELTHFVGYKHNGNSPTGNGESVPYQANRAVESCFK